jgi:4-hydroxy-3-methylbut-2-enyl diphosphate reductase
LAVAAPLRVEAWSLRRGLADARVLRTGMGPAKARRAAEQLRSAPEQTLAVAGLCGSVCDELCTGDVVIANELSIAGEVVTDLELCDAECLAESVDSLGLRARVGRIECCERVARGDARARIGKSGAIAVDMESAWLARGAAARPLCVLRVVLDTPGRELVRPGIVIDSVRALAALRRAAPALESWSRTRGT